MSKKTLFILLVLVAMLAAIWGVQELANRRQAGHVPVLSIDVLKGIDPAQVQEIEMSKGEEKVLLKYQGEAWKVGEKDADAEKVKGALDALQGASFTGPVARAKENHDTLGVGEQGEKVVVKQGDKMFAFRVGRGGPTYDSSYVRLEGEDAVFLADVNLEFSFSSSQSSWEKKEEAKD